ncbi:hypothetical protein CKAH01_03091 [Colletotrichum kahawae]|uniref:BTB domain-containing protein n=1 Tax=Colletotrichum kahawae TaxID=34407 RepID=A0AAD9YWR3_COLKA|nr:hypothetical protein CKAH01_03091 [Colletotrichum kahawae]
MDESSSTQNEEIVAKAEGDTQDCQLTKLAEKMNIASLFLAPEKEDYVTLKAGGKTFAFKKSILIKDSKYFATCFKNENFIEGKTLTVEFDDIDPDLLGIYLHLASMQAIKDSVKFDPGLMKEPKRLKPMVYLYEIADRFMNAKMTGLVGCSILEMALDHPINKSPLIMTDEERSWAMKNYKEAFEAINSGGHAREFMREKLVAAYCHWVLLGNFRYDLVALEDAPEFVRELTISFASLLADQNSEWATSRERLRGGWSPWSWPNAWNVNTVVLDTGNWTHWRPFPPSEATSSSPHGWGSTSAVRNNSASPQSSDTWDSDPSLAWFSTS